MLNYRGSYSYSSIECVDNYAAVIVTGCRKISREPLRHDFKTRPLIHCNQVREKTHQVRYSPPPPPEKRNTVCENGSHVRK